MSLGLALQNALSGLAVSQKSLTVLGQNISNVNTEGYTRKVVEQSPVTINGEPAGVQLSEIVRKVDEYLARSTRTYNSQSQYSAKLNEVYNQVQLIFGDPNSDNNLQGYVDNFFSSVKYVSDNPENASVRRTAIESATNMAKEINKVTLDMEEARFRADQDINLAVGEINNLIDKVFDINTVIGISSPTGAPDANILDQRDKHLKDLSAYLNISTYLSDDNTISVYTGDGVPLIDNGRFHLKYTPAASVDTFKYDNNLNALEVYAVNDAGETTGAPLTLIGSGKSSAVVDTLTGGSLKGLQEMRDVNIPKIIATMDEMAAKLRDAVNAIHNNGSGFPPATTLTGTYEMDGGDLRDWEGVVRFGVVNKGGKAPPTGYTSEAGGFRPLNLNLGSLNVGNGAGRLDTKTIIDEFNSHFGSQQKKVTIGNLNDVRLVHLGDNNPAASTFSFDLDLENISGKDAAVTILAVTPSTGTATFTSTANTVVTGDKRRSGVDQKIDVAFGSAGAKTIDVQFQVVDEDGNTSVATVTYSVNTATTEVRNNRIIGTLGTITSGSAHETIPSTNSRLASMQLVDSLGTSIASTSTGYMKITVEDPATYGLSIDQLNSKEKGLLTGSPAVTASNKGFSSYYELNDLFVNTHENADNVKGAALALQVRADIKTNPNLLSTGKMVLVKQPANPTSAPYYSYELGSGGNQVSEQMAALAKTSLTFSAAGNLPQSSKPISNYVSDIVGNTASNAKQAETNAKKDEYLYNTFNDRNQAVSGVNLDQELANTIIFQNAYTANARVISVVNQMFDALFNAL